MRGVLLNAMFEAKLGEAIQLEVDKSEGVYRYTLSEGAGGRDGRRNLSRYH